MIPFISLPGFGNPHLQTISRSNFFRVKALHNSERIRLDTMDGDILNLDVVIPTSRAHPVTPSDGTIMSANQGIAKEKSAGVVLLLHGLEGSSDRPYIVSMVNHLVSSGYTTVAMNHRSCGGEPPKTKVTYHAGFTQDAELVLDWIGQQFKGQPVHAVGFSLGGCILLNLLHRSSAAEALCSSVSVSSPVHLGDSSKALQSGIGRLYEWYFIRSLQKKNLAMQARFPDYPPFTGKTLLEFDDQVTARVNGFSSAEDYYLKNSPADFIERIEKPVMMIHSLDDPICPWRLEERLEERLKNHPFVTLKLTPQGGHVAFLSRPSGWLERSVADYFAVQTGAG